MCSSDLIGRMANIYHKIHRLSVDFQSNEPRLDDATCIPGLISQVEMDRSLSVKIDEAANCLAAALFYFELSALPEKRDGRYVAAGHVLCAIRRGDPAFAALSSMLSGSLRFFVNDWPCAAQSQTSASFDSDGNFRMPVEVETPGTFTLKAKQGASNAYNISGSPLSVERLIDAQGLDAPFGREDHGRRKRPWPCTGSTFSSKRQRCGGGEQGKASTRVLASLAKRSLAAKGVRAAGCLLMAGLT